MRGIIMPWTGRYCRSVVLCALAICAVTWSASQACAATFAYETSYPWVITDTVNYPSGRIALGIQSSGKAIMAGDFSKASSAPTPTPPATPTPGILRLTTDGGLDAAFNPGAGISGGSVSMDALVVQPDDKILVAGRFTSVGGKPHLNLARLDVDGAVDAGFTADCDGEVYALGLMGDGRIYVGGAFNNVNGKPSAKVARINRDGSFDPSFSPNFGAVSAFGVQALGVQSDGKVILAGGFFNGGKFAGMVRLNTDGSLDTSFQIADYTLTFPAAIFTSAVKVLPNDRILLAGGFSNVSTQARKGFARFNADGSLDTDWNPALPDGYNLGQLPRQIIVEAGGAVLLGKMAAVNRVDPSQPETVVRFNPDGSLDSQFLGLPQDFLDASNGLAMVAQADGRILVAIRPLSSEYRLKRFGGAAPPTPPAFTVQPVSQTVGEGAQVTFVSEATGTPPLTYQWRRGNTVIAEGSVPSLVLNAVRAADAGAYTVTVSNAAGSVTSVPALLTVTGPQPLGLASLPLGTTATITSGSFLNSYSGCVVGPSGLVLVTSDGGASWRRSETGVTNDLTGIRLVGPVAFISGTGGLLCISTNSGASWRAFNSGTTETFYGLSFYDSQNGFAVGSRGTICRYTSSGWSPLVTGTSETFYDVATIGTTAYAVGSRGTICRYNGVRWIAQDTGVTGDFYGVDFLNENLGLAVGANGVICRYNGSAWIPLNSGVTATLRSVRWVTENLAFATGDGGVFLQTVDGGVSWQLLSVGSTASLYGLAYSSGRGYAFGTGGAGFTFGAPAQPVNLPPTIRIIAPTNGAALLACLPIRVDAEAADPDGAIRSVRFFRGEFPLAEITRAPRPGNPYRTTFHTDAVGFYELRAVATDNLGATAVSDPVTIQVVPPPLESAVVESFDTTNGCALCFRGLIGADYVLQGTLSLTPPVHWVNLQTNTAPEPLLRAIDATATNIVYRFYRFQRVP